MKKPIDEWLDRHPGGKIALCDANRVSLVVKDLVLVGGEVAAVGLEVRDHRQAQLAQPLLDFLPGPVFLVPGTDRVAADEDRGGDP